MGNIKILEASKVTLQGYKNIRLEALREEPQAFGSSYNHQKDSPDADWQDWLNNYIKGERSWMIFAADDDKLVGMLGAFQTDENIENHIAQIIAVYVTKESRGKGISKLLMERLLDKLTKYTQIKKVQLTVNIDQVPALKLYQSFEFKVVGQEDMILGDGLSHKEYLMERELK